MTDGGVTQSASGYLDELDRRALRGDEAAWLEAVLSLPSLVKRAAERYGPGSPSFRKLLEFLRLANYIPPEGIPRKPSPLIATLLGGALGAGVGYSLATPVSWLLPETWSRGNLRRTAAIIGGLLGSSPGLLFGLTNLAEGKSYDDPSGLEVEGYDPIEGRYLPDELTAEDLQPAIWATLSGSGMKKSSQVDPDSLTGLPTFDRTPYIPRYDFHRTIWEDPRVASRLSLPMRAAASGLVEAAAVRSGTDTAPRFVTPADIGRVAVGMGSGYASGWLVGKGLGLLMGMPQQTQEKLKNTGMWAGAVANLIPAVFGR